MYLFSITYFIFIYFY